MAWFFVHNIYVCVEFILHFVLMSKREKIKSDFINSPRRLSYPQIQSFLIDEWFTVIQWKWSHVKIKHTKSWKVFIVPIHNWECKWVYKEELKNFYLSIVN